MLRNQPKVTKHDIETIVHYVAIKIMAIIERKKLIKKYMAGERNFSSVTIGNRLMIDVELPKINLSGADLMGIDFSGANFSFCNMGHTILTAAKFHRANLEYVGMENAIVIATDFRDAKNFRGPDLDSFVCNTFRADGSFFEGPEWVE